MADETHNPRDQDGVPLYGPMADYVSAATRTAVIAQQERFAKEGRLRPDLVKQAVNAAKANAIAEWRTQNPKE